MPQKTLQQNKRRNILVAAVMLGFVLVFCGMFAAYIYIFKERMEASNHTRLAEVSRFITSHMNTVVSQTQEALQVVADAVGVLDTREKRLSYLHAVAERYSFAYMGYADSSGELHNTASDLSENVTSEAYFLNAWSGNPTASNLVRRIFPTKAISGIMLAVPLRLKEDDGVLVAMLSVRSFSAALQLETFGGEGATYIIDRRGSVVMRTRSLDISNLFTLWRSYQFDKAQSFQQVVEHISFGREGLAAFTNRGGQRQYAYYRPLQFNGWMVVTVVSEQAVFGETLSLAEYLAFLVGGTMLLFMGLLFWNMRSHRISMESRTAAETKSAFLANMSHEIRTPMNAIVGISEIMLRAELPPRQREQLMSIRNSGKGLLTIINDILDISKIEAGGFAVVDEPYELESLLYDLTIISVIRLGEKPVQFMVEVEAGVPRMLVGDMGRVKQILLNIVGNAVKFTESGAIHLLLSTTREGDKWRLEVAVTDTGMGIRPGDLEKLFVRFAQVDTRRNRNVEGTGLGLTISQKLCELMGGSIDVTSTYGEGSTFTITLRQGVDEDASLLVCPVTSETSLLLCEPLPELRLFEISCLKQFGVRYKLCATQAAFMQAMRTGDYTHVLAPRQTLRALPPGMKPQVARVELLAQREHAFIESSGASVYLPLFATQLASTLNGGQASSRVRRHTGMEVDSILPMPYVSVLVVDDNELNIQVAEGLMMPYNMRVHHASSGRKALRMVQMEDFDLVLMDHMMPDLDGVETLQLIRSLPGDKFVRLPVVALTANTTNEARQLFKEKGFNDFLSKPIETTRLNAVLVEWLNDVNMQRAAEQSSDATLSVLGDENHAVAPDVGTVSELLAIPEAPENHEVAKTSASTGVEVVAPVVPVASAAQSGASPAPAGRADTLPLVMDCFVEVDFNAGKKRLPLPGLYVKILRSFVVSTGEKLAALPDWMDKDPNRVVIEVHGLKSASASIGALGFSEAAYEMEMRGKAGEFEVVRAGLPNFVAHGRRVIAEIEVYLQGV